MNLPLAARCFSALLLCSAALAAQPATRPAGPTPQILERVEMALQNVKLTDDQKTKIDAILNDARQQMNSMRGELEGLEPQQRMQKLGPMFQQLRDDIVAVLDNDQRAQLERRMEQFRQRVRERERGQLRGELTTRPNRQAGEAMTDTPMMSDDMMETAGRKSDEKSEQPTAAEIAPLSSGPQVGDAAPAFKLQRLDGPPLELSQLKGRITVLVFGSLTCPSFRQRAASLEKLRVDYGSRASVFIVYGKEAHPLGEWEVARNKDDGISMEQPRDVDARRALAGKIREGLKLGAPILIDTMENEMATAYGAGPNSAYVIGRDGKIVARQHWFEASALRRAIDKAVAVRPAAAGQ